MSCLMWASSSSLSSPALNVDDDAVNATEAHEARADDDATAIEDPVVVEAVGGEGCGGQGARAPFRAP